MVLDDQPLHKRVDDIPDPVLSVQYVVVGAQISCVESN
jgi:hypothetical protein